MSRKLDRHDRIVWNRVARTVTPRRRPHGKGAAKPEIKPGPTREDFSAMMRLPPLRSTFKSVSGPVPLSADKTVRRGRVDIDSRIDLHGLTQVEARDALAHAVMRRSKRGGGCLLVITGKGPRLEGVLRAQLPQWLSEPDLRPHITTFAPAHARHGGAGAWYVFLPG